MSRHPRSLCALAVLLATLYTTIRAAEQRGVHLRFSLAADKPVEVTVSGRIVDAKTEKPIPNALVRGHVAIWRHKGPEMFKQSPHAEVRTDKKGEYQLCFVTPLTTSGGMKGKDMICLDVSAAGYETRPLWVRPFVTPKHNRFTDVDLTLGPGKLLKGKVVDEDQRPIANATVRVQNGSSAAVNYFGSLGVSTTDADGRFEIWCSTDKTTVIGAAPWLRISKRGYGTGFFWGLLEKESMGTLVVPRGGTIAGKVVDIEGRAIPDCEVLVLDDWPNEIDKSVTDEQGNYQLKGVPGENVLAEFYQRKNKQKPHAEWMDVTVYARRDAATSLRDVPQYTILAKDGQTVNGRDLVIGANTSVSGRLIPSKTTGGLQGLMVRLDTGWDKMVEANAEGRFRFPLVSPGKHRLTAYLPNNLRGDRGIGHIDIDVQAGQPLRDVTIPLETLTEVRVQFLDADGNPLEGITAGATWTKSGDGFWTQGTQSDQDGWAVLYLYPGDVQYVRGFDLADRHLVSEGYERVKPEAGQVIGNLRITVVPAAGIKGRVLDESKTPVAEKRLVARLRYADGVQRRQSIKTDDSGRFQVAGLVPGVVRLRVETLPVEMSGSLAEAVEIKPGQSADLGDIGMSPVTFHKVSGQLVASPTFSDLSGFKIRVGLAAWEPMVATDAQGRFVLPKVPTGKHRLTAYLPFNLRTDRGVGHVSVTVDDGDLGNIRLPLETLATVRMRIVDESGKPVPGVSAAAWWTADHSGVFTEGTKSDEQGNATLYLYPGQQQYVGAHDWDGRYRLRSHHELTPDEGTELEQLMVTVVPAARKN